jgi:hypothetical protein
MEIRALKIEGAFEVTRQFPDDRGVFMESFRGDRLAEGRPPRPALDPLAGPEPHDSTRVHRLVVHRRISVDV